MKRDPDAEPAEEIKVQARQYGFDAAGICDAVTSPEFDHLVAWLRRGYGGSMRYLADRLPAYRQPDLVLDGVRSLVMLTVNYQSARPRPDQAGSGRISRYAWGSADYHDVVHGQLRKLVSWMAARWPGSRHRGVVDTAPLLERAYARQAGLGWQGKNTMLISPTSGSYFFLAAVLTDLELEPDRPFTADHCGTCRACLEACPTQAFPQPYLLDATRCISYLTIEHRGPVELPLRTQLAGWLFGCDVCQEVCPWNRHAPWTDREAFTPLPAQDPVALGELFSLDEEAFRRRFRRSPLWRARRRGLLRNAALLLGGQQYTPAVPALAQGLADRDALVRGASAWALGQLQSAAPAARVALTERLAGEQDPTVRGEIQQALRMGDGDR